MFECALSGDKQKSDELKKKWKLKFVRSFVAKIKVSASCKIRGLSSTDFHVVGCAVTNGSISISSRVHIYCITHIHIWCVSSARDGIRYIRSSAVIIIHVIYMYREIVMRSYVCNTNGTVCVWLYTIYWRLLAAHACVTDLSCQSKVSHIAEGQRRIFRENARWGTNEMGNIWCLLICVLRIVSNYVGIIAEVDRCLLLKSSSQVN